jgi:hypothetical protein
LVEDSVGSTNTEGEEVGTSVEKVVQFAAGSDAVFCN